jgi:hypothetical protein
VVRGQAGVHARYPSIEKSKSCRSLSYALDVEIPCYETRRVTVVFDARHTPAGVRVFADGPEESRHRYDDGTICMGHPDDPADLRWTPEDGLADLIEMTRPHLFREAYWRETGVWLGSEVHSDGEGKGSDE